VDLCGPFPETARGHTYCLVAIEHFTKLIIAVPIRGKTPAVTAYAFAHEVLGRFGACVEVVHDNGGEWEADFDALLRRAGIEPRLTSANHPQANGASEKAVGIVKTALKKVSLQQQDPRGWDLEVPWVLLGYNCSPQRSTGFAPYELLFARAPIVTPAAWRVTQQPEDASALILTQDAP
jgi:transposase InsO family protein